MDNYLKYKQTYYKIQFYFFNIPEYLKRLKQSNVDNNNYISSHFRKIGVLVDRINVMRFGKLSNNFRHI